MLLLPDPFVPGFALPAAVDPAALWFMFAGNRLALLDDQVPSGVGPPLPLGERRRLYMGRWGERDCIAVEIDADDRCGALDGVALFGLRELWGRLDAALVGLAGQALQLVDWDRCHRYCGRCGAETVRRDNERARHCERCGLNHYPRVAPAVMVRITRGDEILLARSPRFVRGMYSVLAGFVDPGESLEQAVRREVMEEVSVRIKDLRYLISQSWPFPHSLMIAFSAEYAGGEIHPADGEIEDAAWFRRGALPRIPPTMSIARWLIDDYLASPRRG